MTAGEPLVAVIIEDDPGVRSLLDEVFLAAGFRTVLAGSGPEGLAAVAAHRPIITTLDINLPGIDGFEVARRIRQVSDTFIIMLSALADESDVVLGLTSGADEYLVKPFRPRELRARIEALLRRTRTPATDPLPLAAAQVPAAPTPVPAASPAPSAALPAGAAADATVATWRGLVHRDLSLDLDTRLVLVAQRPVELTPTEFDLLAALLEAGRRVCSKADLALGLRGASGGAFDRVSEPDKRAIETHMANLRRKLGDSPTAPRYIETVRGVGYRLTSDDRRP
ncbi:response regulator transcription factor [Microbacterium sp. LEMMJ01]|uniref:response regulator transcription factor n=1 Tax=Microbacterium sp. LEMMJ01 TaxID=1978350 RepID=UPI000A1E3362|nr:response regulator transcription factor [Microbacterium sp. LEMMJ01]OSP09226.1 DNA-binding response regulator [Microbacterium sp. LEMMJ01]